MVVSGRTLARGIAGLLGVFTVLSSSAAHADATARVDGVASDVPGFTFLTDPNLIDPIGLASSPGSPTSPGSPAWLGDNGAGVATIYALSSTRQILSLVVSVPSPGNPLAPSGAPTGAVFNAGVADGDFAVSGFDRNGSAASATSLFLFATNNGTIAGWNPTINPAGFDQSKVGTYAITGANVPGSNYTGLTIANNGVGNFLYAANFATGAIDVFDRTFTKLPAQPGAFTDPNLPKGFAPFNIQALNGNLFVTYARIDGGPSGFVDKFTTNGQLIARLVSRDPLSAPYGLAIAPASFGALAGALVVGNHGDGTVDFFDPTSGQFLGKLINPAGGTWTIPGLWALRVGNGGMAGSTNEILFSAGPNDGLDGLFGEITPVLPDTPFTPLNFPSRGGTVPEASSLALLASATVLLCLTYRGLRASPKRASA